MSILHFSFTNGITKKQKNLMNWKAILQGVVVAVLGIVVYEMFVKKMISNELEQYLDKDAEFEGYTERLSA